MQARVLVALATLVFAGCGEAESTVPPPATEPASEAPRGAVAGCSNRSEAVFPPYEAPDNVVVGPFALVGGAHTPAATVREYGGDKLHALVRAGHRVTVSVSGRARLAYGPLPQGETHLRDAHRVVEFVACGPGGPFGSTAGGQPVTFWSGFVLTAGTGCVPLRV